MKYKIIEFREGQFLGKITDFWYFDGRYIGRPGHMHKFREIAEWYPFSSVEEAEKKTKAAIDCIIAWHKRRAERERREREELRGFPRTVKKSRHP
jgi:hypothetical protein